MSKKLGFDTRTTILGHVQRGGTPSAFDRILVNQTILPYDKKKKIKKCPFDFEWCEYMKVCVLVLFYPRPAGWAWKR